MANDGVHPFGTINRCVYFKDGTFLEPITVDNESQKMIEEAVKSGNQFVKRDQVYRFRCGQEGFSALVFATNDAKQDLETFESQGISAGKNLSFGRDFVTPSGEKARAEFELAFAADLRAPDVFFFNCERTNVPNVDRSALYGHQNGVNRIAEVVMWAGEPGVYSALIATLTNKDKNLSNSSISIHDIKTLKEKFGIVPKFLDANHEVREKGLRLCGIVFDVDNLSHVREICESAYGPQIAMNGGTLLVVPETTGQGAFFAFQQAAH